MFIDANECQLLFVHLQDDVLEPATAEDRARIARAAGVLAELGSLLHMPVTFGLVPPEKGVAQPIGSLRAHADEANTFHRQIASVFLHPPLAGRLADNRRPILLIAGYTTEVAVLHAALDGLAAGFRVRVLIDAIGGMSTRTEQVALDQIAHAGGELTSVAALASMLAPDFAAEPGSAVLSLIKSLGSG